MKKVYQEIHKSSLDVLKYLSKLAPTYSILGNVGENMLRDYKVRKDEEKYNVKLPYFKHEINKIDNLRFVRNRLRLIDGLRIGFLEYFIDNSWIKEFNQKDKKKIANAKRETEKAQRVLNGFGKNLDILVCHQSPYGYLDKVGAPAPEAWRGKHAGSKAILNYIRKSQPKYVFCGHIHEGEGRVKIGNTEVYNLGVAGHKIINFS